MSQFPSVFENPLVEGNLNNLQLPQSNYTQMEQRKLIGFNNQQKTDKQQHLQQQEQQQQQQQQPMIDSYLSANPYLSPLYHNNYCLAGSEKQAPQTHLMSMGQRYSSLPPITLDQIRSCTTTSSPIFILPNGISNSNQLPAYPMPFLSPTCIPYSMPLPIYQPSECECKCAFNKTRNCLNGTFEKHENDGAISKIENNREFSTKYCYKQNIEDVCSNQNCLASIQLQAIISQLLGIHGIISSTIIRLLLKKIPSTNISDSAEEIMQCAARIIRQLPKDQLLKESKSCQEVNGLLRLYLTSSTIIARIIPILTSVQLKSNILKALIDNLINARIMDDQGFGAENPEPLDVLYLELKSDDELRQLLSILREKECQERVNLSFAVYKSQSLIMESRLTNIQRKIAQLEQEMDRRHSNITVQESYKKLADLNLYAISCDYFGYNKSQNEYKKFKSPDPFLSVHISNPKKLLLKPHVGSPETTYTKPNDNKKSNVSKSSIENVDNCSSFYVETYNEETMRYIQLVKDENHGDKSISNNFSTERQIDNINATDTTNTVDKKN
ncbi:PREDICTED: uncharacterized protein LOC105364079 [Ceratosolen solmsi marchali]|uniref:Uncharacterized protein LOC105364079 n=1 Tax=Ceratosolen solmsi marchali TaxID=326594 RepID=A0AAJ6YLG6_9HYME|nr:PREDICTED: uncharacterized protein LOC105364079 [Ceratosolen solmsi marchali]